MSKEIYISSTPHETRLAIVENDALTEIYYERENEYTLAGSIYNGKVTRVLPGMQSSFVDIGLDRDAFLYITDFMEEAGETADFEASGTGSGEPRRAPREGGRGGDRNDRGPRQDRGAGRNLDSGERPALPRPEPTDAELFTDAVSSLEPSRPVSDSERGERSGNRRGGRNRRDRNSDGTPRRERTDAPRVDAPRVDAPRLMDPIVTAPEEPSGELGEGAPGADGSRRWRGRRGRRGNRGTGSPAISGAPHVETPHRTENTGPVYDAYGTDEPMEAEAPVAAEPVSTEREPRREREGRGDRNRRPQAPPRVPRGFTPSHDLYQVEGAADESIVEPAVEPLILPGESLSKYRAPAEGSTASAPTVAETPAASTEFVAQGWDGGLVLPGETIRPRSASVGSRTEAPREFTRREGGRDDRGGRDRNRNERGGRRDDHGPRPERTERPRQAAEAVAPSAETHASEPVDVVEAQHAPAPEHAPEPQLTSHVVTPLNSTHVAPPPMPFAADGEAPVTDEEVAVQEMVAEDLIEHEEIVHEYEPAEASASYRIDPVAPSEFRQSAPVMEEEFVQEEMAHAAEVPVVSAAFAETAAEEPALAEHEFTSIFPTGEMHSESPALITQDLVAASPAAQGAEHSSEPLAADMAAADQTVPVFEVQTETIAAVQSESWFAPGTGVLEEEMLDDDELGEDESATLPNVQASRDYEPHEQVALENAADLGTMLREMSIDQLTRSEPAVEEEDDDFDEDFLEEDQDFSLEVSEADEFEDEEAESDGALQEGVEGEEEAERAAYGADESALVDSAAAPATEVREPRRNDRGRRDGRRGDRNRRSGDRDRGGERGNTASDRPSGDRDRRGHGGRPSMQMTNLPAISDLLKPGQEILCQIAKEPIAKKGARITSHIALPGRFLVFMPTVNHTGVSRKIESDGERRRLKEILLSEKGEAAGGFIVRTAASGASEEELRSDLRFLLNLWQDIKTRSESSKSPALIYHDLNLVERVLRDQVTDTFSAIWVDTETDYERILRFLQRFQPSLIRRVKLYTKETPLFEQFGITEEINKALRSKVWLKSGGSIVINQTEALVAIDINTGKFVGKTARLEDTIVKTNLDAIPEIVRQIRLRDLGGIIIIDFIDMDERKNRNKVMAALEEELKTDRAPSKVLPFNDFGLVAITRKRVKQSLERTLSTTCGICQGTGMVKSPVTVCNDIYIEMRKMQKHLDRGDVMLRVHPEVVKQLKSTSSRWLQEMEEMVGKTILVKSDPSLHPEQFDLH